MATKIETISNYEDEHGNRIECPDGFSAAGPFTIRGKNNVLRIADGSRLQRLLGSFDGNGGLIEIGGNPRSGAPSLNIRCGGGSAVRIGEDLSTTATAFISAVEGATVTIGRDVMMASDNQIRADDAHPIYDVRTKKRANPARDITIGDHVWLGFSAVVLGGSTVGSGSVVGFRALVSGSLPNNVVAAGIPAKVVKRHVAWERPHLSLNADRFKPNGLPTTISAEYWELTSEAETPRIKAPIAKAVAPGKRLRHAAGRLARRMGLRRS